MKTNVEISVTPDMGTVPFSDLSNGEWFLWEDRVGVKVDGVGFYPATTYRGTGYSDALVTRMSTVRITAVR